MAPDTPIGTFSGVPAWLQEILPQWFIKRPAFTEAVYATFKSGLLGMSILLIGAAQDGSFAKFGGTIAWVGDHWWALIVAGGVAALRGKEAHSKASIATSMKGPP